MTILNPPKKSPEKEPLDPRKIEAAKQIILGPSATITKVPRAGATTSMAAALEELGIPALFVAPYNKIQTSTIASASDSFLPVLAHKNCKRVEKRLKKDPFLKKLPITIPECFECKEMAECRVFAPRTDLAMITSMTYAKLLFLMLVDTKESREIIERLQERVKVVIFDESHIIGLGTAATIGYDKDLVIPMPYSWLRYVFHSRFGNIMVEHKEKVEALERDASNVLGAHGHYAFKIKIDHPLSEKETRTSISQLLKLTNHRKELDVSEETILSLFAAITIMTNPTAVIHLIRDDETGVMKTLVTSQTNILQLMIKELVQRQLPDVKVFFVSGTQYEPWEGFYEDLAGRGLEQVVFPDFDNSNAQMTIYPDSRKIGAWDAWKNKEEIERVCNEIRVISEKEYNQRIYLLTINKYYSGILKKRLENEFPNIFFDYYRSDNTQGVENVARICIAVMPAVTPATSFDHLTRGCGNPEVDIVKDGINRSLRDFQHSSEQEYEESRRLRLLNVHADTRQAWSRVKDPYGKVPSKVYCIGIRADEISEIATWGVGRRIEMAWDDKGRLKGKVICDGELMGRPNVGMEQHTPDRMWPSKRTIADYIDRVVPIRDFLNFKQKTCLFPYSNISGEMAGFSTGLSEVSSKSIGMENTTIDYNGIDALRLYNNHIVGSPEFQQTHFALQSLFLTRIDQCGVMWKKVNWKGEWGYSVGMFPCSPSNLLQLHLEGKETMAITPFDDQDTCYFGALDFDDHTGYTPQADNVVKLSTFMITWKIPHIVVKSGTNDGYHVFVPLVPTKTYTAMKFMKQLIKDAGLDKLVGLERYPKQKSVATSRNGYGSQIKVPLGYNWKAGKMAVVVDSQTLQPVQCLEVPSALALRDVPEPENGFKNKPRGSAGCSGVGSEATYSEMLPCLSGALAEGVQFNEGDGNQMRVAIAADAFRTGKTEEEAIALFSGQGDFDEVKTRKHVHAIYKAKYRRSKCETLRDQCSRFVSKYCERCKYNGNYSAVK